VTSRPTFVGYAVLGAFVLASVYAIRNGRAAAAQMWVKALQVRQGITEVLWKATSDPPPRAELTHPTAYDPETNEWVWQTAENQIRTTAHELAGFR